MEHYELSSSLFADKIGVQRSSMSHILKGRNRPSLDFIMRLIETFPEVNLYWLLNGKGDFPVKEEKIKQSILKGNIEHSKKMQKIVVFYMDGTFESFEPKK